MVINIQIFMLGFLVNSALWRFEKGTLADTYIPVVLSVLCLSIISIQSFKKDRKV